ncbi:MAG: DUF4351 domain-containing protein [Magnetococcales bacterium]|nr:DUF4351 domain-containing protein [Magnetococcales bacterium]
MADLGPIPNDLLARHARLKAGLLALKYGTRDPKEQMEALDLIASALIEVPELLIEVMLYLFTTFQYLDESTVHEIVIRVCPQETVEMISIFARNIIEQHKHIWLQEGELKGKLDGEAKILTRQLQRRFGSVPAWANEKIAKADSTVLEEWSFRVLEAQSLESVFSD